MAGTRFSRTVGFTAVYALVDASLELSASKKHVSHHAIATTTAAAWVHAASTRSTANIVRAVGTGLGLGLVSAPLYWLMFSSDLLSGSDARPKSILELLQEGGSLLRDKGR